jgi:hypothetical protein
LLKPLVLSLCYLCSDELVVYISWSLDKLKLTHQSFGQLLFHKDTL